MNTTPNAESLRPPTVVLDTNAVLDAWVFADPCMGSVLAALACGRLNLVASPRLREELVHTLALPQLQAWKPDLGQVMALFDRHATLVADPAKTPLRSLWCSDTDDQVFIDLALEQHAQWLLTKDRALLRLARHAKRVGVQIVQPARWKDTDQAGLLRL
jgi:putative PIN family toxin of toxin-antitoxin system